MYIIVGGGGDVGYYLTRTLLRRGHEVLLLEKTSARVQILAEELGQSVIKGDACEARTMQEAGAQRADVVIAVTGEDDDNLVICQMAKKRFNVARTIARLNDPKHEELFQKLGIDVTVSPTKAILSLIESELPGPHFIPLMTLKKAGIEIVAMNIPPMSQVAGKKLSELNLPRKSTLALIMRGTEPIFPDADTVLLENDEIYALLNNESEEELSKIFGTT